MISAKPNNKLCKYAWTEVSFKRYQPKLQANPCCNMDRPHIQPLGIVADELNPVEILNSAEFEELRQSMLRGEEHPACRHCWDLEAVGARSPRLNTPESFDEIPKLEVVDLDSGNVCNLRCRMCNGGSSSSIYQMDLPIAQELKLVNLPAQYHEGDGVYTSEERVDSIQWKWIKENGDKLRLIKVSGGEPLMDKHFVQFLADLKDKSNLSINFHTNGTKFTDDNINILMDFKSVTPHISIDGVGKVFEYTRHPAKWDKVATLVENLTHELLNIRFTKLNVVVSAMNVLNLDEIITWVENNTNPALKINISYDIVYPVDRGMAIKHLPVNILEESIRRLKQVNKRLAQPAITIIQAAIDDNHEDHDKLKAELVAFDLIKKQSYRDFLDPWLVEYLDSPSESS